MESHESIELNYCYNCMHHLTHGETICPECGHDNSIRLNENNALPEGTILCGRYLIGKVLGQGGFGITYLGVDVTLSTTRVAIKEYFPSGLGMRVPGTIRITALSANKKDDYQKGCDEFRDEALRLAGFNSPNVVNVRDFFHENGTAYIVMDYVEGRSLTQEVMDRGGRLPWERVVRLFKPLIMELDKLHRKQLIHRDIKPDNLWLKSDESGKESLVLLDFGSARSFVSEITKTYTALATPGYTPIEQYNRRSRQGPYTDVYAICATMYAAITGNVPPTATERLAEDAELKTFQELNIPVPETVEKAIRHGLEVKSADRPQTMSALYEELTGEAAPPEAETEIQQEKPAPNRQKKEPSEPAGKEIPEPGHPEKKKNSWLLLLLLAIVLLAGGYFGWQTIQKNNEQTAMTQTMSVRQTQEAEETRERKTVSAIESEQTQTAERQTEQALQTRSAVEADQTQAAEQQKMTEQAQQTRSAQETSTQDALHAEQTGTAWAATKQAELQGTETQSAIVRQNTQTAQAEQMERTVQVETQSAQQTQEAQQAEQTAAAWFATQEAELHQTQTQSAEETQTVRETQSQQTAAAVQQTQEALEQQTRQAEQTAAALQSTQEAEEQLTGTTAANETQTMRETQAQQTEQVRQTASAQQRQTETQTYREIQTTQEALEQQTRQAEQTAAALLATQEAEQQMTGTTAAEETRIAEETRAAETVQVLQTEQSWKSTERSIYLEQTELAVTQAAVSFMQTEAAWKQTEEAIRAAKTEMMQTMEVLSTPQPQTGEPTSFNTPELTITPSPTHTITADAAISITPEPALTATPAPTHTITPEPTLTNTTAPTHTSTPVMTPKFRWFVSSDSASVSLLSAPEDGSAPVQLVQNLRQGTEVNLTGETQTAAGQKWVKVTTEPGNISGWLPFTALAPEIDPPTSLNICTQEPVQIRERIRDIDEMTEVFVPAGWFIMGSGESDAPETETPVHIVTLGSFWIDKTEVSNRQYAKCVSAGACSEPKQAAESGQDDYPVVNVNWNQALAYCRWVGGALPTEAQWEKAARGSCGNRYPWGNDADDNKANLKRSHDHQALPVDSYPEGASVYGALNLLGNVMEWTNDWYDEDYYNQAAASSDDPHGPAAGKQKTMRGGAWGFPGTTNTTRFFGSPNSAQAARGFRCVREGE